MTSRTTLVAAALTAALAAAPALAQPAQQPQPVTQDASQSTTALAAPVAPTAVPGTPGMHRVPMNTNYGHDGMQDGMVPTMPGRAPMSGFPRPGAHVHIQRADVGVDVTCRDDETTRDCMAVAEGAVQHLTPTR